MRSKYSSYLTYTAVYLYRERLRRKIADLVSWRDLQDLEPGCTVVIGMCSRLPNVLLTNLNCLNDNAWPELSETIVVVDNIKGSLPLDIEREAVSMCNRFRVKFLYYNTAQHCLAEKIRLPYVFSWLSWCIGLGACSTRHILLHDYDALIVSRQLGHHYRSFAESDAKMQGISYYQSNGVVEDDRLVATFEAFVDLGWIRTFRPIQLFNKVGVHDGRFIDFDTTLHIQHYKTKSSERRMVPLSIEDIIHPTQMIHQYTMFRRFPGRVLPCFAVPLVPCFEYLTVGEEAILRAIRQLSVRTSRRFRFLQSDLLVNFELLDVAQIDYCLKLAVQLFVSRDISPFASFYQYGLKLYQLADCPEDLMWVGDFNLSQLRWIGRSRIEYHNTKAW